MNKESQDLEFKLRMEFQVKVMIAMAPHDHMGWVLKYSKRFREIWNTNHHHDSLKFIKELEKI